MMGFVSLKDETFIDPTTFYDKINVSTRNPDKCNKNNPAMGPDEVKLICVD